MIDIVRDYASIGVGTAQAVTTSAARAGRGAVGRVVGVADAGGVPGTSGGVSPREALDRSRGVMGGLLNPDVDAVITRLGLAKRSELNAVRQQMARLERRLGDVRGDR